MKQIPGFETGPKSHIYKLKKSIYGLKQSPRDWWILLRESLRALNWTPTISDECLFTRFLPCGTLCYLLVYVDDIIIVAPTLAAVDFFKQELKRCFSMKDLGEVNCILGIKVTRTRPKKLIKLDQSALISQYSVMYGKGIRRNHCPVLDVENQNNQDHPLFDENEFLSRTSALQYISGRTRPDIAAIVGFLSRRVKSHTIDDCATLTKIFDYLETTKSMSLTLNGNGPLNLSTYVDADWAGDPNNRLSTSGAVLYVGKSPIIWYSKRQQCQALSTMEAEYVAMTESLKDISFIKNMLTELKVEIPETPVLYCDNQAAIAVSLSQGNRRRVRHIDLRFHYIRDYVERGDVVLKYINTSDNRSDSMTKTLGKIKFIISRDLLCVY